LGFTAVIDYGAGNLDSIKRSLEECGSSVFLTSDKKEIQKASHIILPGVGVFFQAMNSLQKLNLITTIRTLALEEKIPLLGVCLGMQLLADSGNEGGTTNGLGLIPGIIEKLQPKNIQEKIPHVGWNQVEFKNTSLLVKGLQNEKDFYFVHSYYFKCSYVENIIGETPYCGNFPSIIGKDNVFGVQFHPEKSQKIGFALLKNFLNL
jgi:imidazole glycerol-phosphate synthase subunit HisH